VGDLVRGVLDRTLGLVDAPFVLQALVPRQRAGSFLHAPFCLVDVLVGHEPSLLPSVPPEQSPPTESHIVLPLWRPRIRSSTDADCGKPVPRQVVGRRSPTPGARIRLAWDDPDCAGLPEWRQRIRTASMMPLAAGTGVAVIAVADAEGAGASI